MICCYFDVDYQPGNGTGGLTRSLMKELKGIFAFLEYVYFKGKPAGTLAA